MISIKRFTAKRFTRKMHINLVKSGDTILHNGEEKTVTKQDIKSDGFMGKSVFGDSYRSGTQLVEVVFWKVAELLGQTHH